MAARPTHRRHAADADGVLREFTRWCADYQSAGLRRGLQIALGVLWLLDAALQFQPFMFGAGFPQQVIEPAQAGSPTVITAIPLFAAHLIIATQPVANTLFATAQLLLGASLLWRPAVKAGLAGSVAWGVMVWWLGEGLGGVLADGRLFTGAPGAAVLYALLALLLWPTGQRKAGAGMPVSVADGGLLGRRGARLAWLALWAGSALLALAPANRAPRALQQSIAAQASGEPGFLASLDQRAATVVGGHGLPASLALVVIALLVGVAVFVPAVTRAGLVLAVLLALAIWLVGEDLGGILTGQGTDPNSGPLLILLAAAFWPLRTVPARPGTRGALAKEANAPS